MKAHKEKQKFAGLQFKYYGPFDGHNAAEYCALLNGKNKVVGFGTYSQ
jgi:deoxyxylulose-5-phosphate synthase